MPASAAAAATASLIASAPRLVAGRTGHSEFRVGQRRFDGIGRLEAAEHGGEPGDPVVGPGSRLIEARYFELVDHVVGTDRVGSRVDQRRAMSLGEHRSGEGDGALRARGDDLGGPGLDGGFGGRRLGLGGRCCRRLGLRLGRGGRRTVGVVPGSARCGQIEVEVADAVDVDRRTNLRFGDA